MQRWDTVSHINHFLISYGTGYEAVPLGETLVEIRGSFPSMFPKTSVFDKEELLTDLEKVGSTAEIYDIVGRLWK